MQEEAASASSSSLESSMRLKELVGGNCLGAPTTTSCVSPLRDGLRLPVLDRDIAQLMDQR
jgi:hypothetical protein